MRPAKGKMLPFTKSANALLCICCALFVSCWAGPDSATAPTPRDVVLANDPQQIRVDSVARAVAIVLANDGIRQKVHDDLRDSPFRNHRIHLRSYFRGTAGGEVGRATASILGISFEALLGLLETLPELELIVPRATDRVSWKGREPLIVMGTALPFMQRLKNGEFVETAYRSGGEPIATDVFFSPPGVLVVIQPAERTYPPDVEARRLSAGHQNRSTITTAKDERAEQRRRGRESVAAERNFQGGSLLRLVQNTCSPEGGDPYCCDPSMDYCPEPPQEGGMFLGGGGALLPESDSYMRCMGNSVALDGSNDRDNNGILDDCEEDIALALRPIMNFGEYEDCGAHDPYWSISRHPDRPNHVQIFYALSYLEDCGTWPLDHHHGDSEFVIIEAMGYGGENSVNPVVWGAVNVTFSAHFDGPLGSDATATYAAYDLEFPARPNVRVWVSEDKHANYRSKAVCDSGPNGWHTDDCLGDYIGGLLTIPSGRNLGNFFNVPVPRNPLTRFITDTHSSYPGRSGVENYWDGSEFSGWMPAGSREPSATRYNKMLEIYGF